jgi:tight adherence protein C
MMAAVLAAVGAGLIATSVVRSRVPLAQRVELYNQRTRSQLGTVIPERVQGPRTVWGPMITILADGFARLMGGGSITEQKLRQAGMGDVSLEDARRQQLAFTAGGIGLGVLMALVLQLGAASALLLVVVSAIGGFTRWRSRIDRAIRLRSERLRAEAHVMCQTLAMYLRTGDNPQPACERLVRRSRGEVSHDLGRAVSLIRSGSTAREVFDRTAQETAEPSAARLYRMLGSSWDDGGDANALMQLSESLRESRRQGMKRTMARRRVFMVLPMTLILGPIILLFIIAPIPSIILNR